MHTLSSTEWPCGSPRVGGKSRDAEPSRRLYITVKNPAPAAARSPVPGAATTDAERALFVAGAETLMASNEMAMSLALPFQAAIAAISDAVQLTTGSVCGQ